MIKIIALGDSIFAGWDGKENLPHYKRIPEIIGQINDWLVDNEAIGGDSYHYSFASVAERLDFADQQLALINYGVNDWNFNSSLLDVTNGFEQGIAAIRRSNPHIKVVVVGPTLDMRRGIGTTLDTPNSVGMTQNQLSDALSRESDKLGIDFIDMRKHHFVTTTNAGYTLGDSFTGVHPTAETSLAIAKLLAKKLNGGI